MSSLTNSTLTVDTLDCSGIKLKNDSAYLRDDFPFYDYSFDISGAFRTQFSDSNDGGIQMTSGNSIITLTLGDKYPDSNDFKLTSTQTATPKVTVSNSGNNYTITTTHSGLAGNAGLGVTLGDTVWPLKFHQKASENYVSHRLNLRSSSGATSNECYLQARCQTNNLWTIGGTFTQVEGIDRPGLYTNVAHGLAGIIGIASDVRVKENILPITNAIASINKVNILKYDKLQEDKYIPDVGVVAQELEETKDPLLLQCVVIPVNKENLYTVNYNSLFAIHVKALQELYQDITQNKRETMTLLERLENKINILEKNN